MTLKQPHNVPISNRDYQLSHDYTYQWQEDGARYKIYIAAGLVYDGASIPRIFWTFTGMRPDGLLRAAALIHDFIYIYEGKMPAGSHQVFIDGEWEDVHDMWTRKEADRIFVQLLKEAGVSRFRRRLAYRAVRMGGWIAWR